MGGLFYANAGEEKLLPQCPVDKRWPMDETYIKVKGALK